MSSSKDLPRREWMLGVLAVIGSSALAAGCDNTAEDPGTFSPNVDVSRAAKTSDAPLAKDDDDAAAIPRKKKK